MLGLRDEIRRYPLGVAFVGRDDDLRWAGVEVDRAIGGDKRLGGGDVLVARPDDLVNAWNGCRAVREGGDRLRASHTKQPGDAGDARRGHHNRRGTRARDDHFAHAGGASRDCGHQ